MIHGLENLLPKGELGDFYASIQSFSDRCVRIRVDRATESLPFSTEPVPWFPQSYWITTPDVRPGGTLAYAAADFYIQDAASLLPLRLLDIQPDDRVCDLCAAPGGKATAIAERLGPHGILVANEAIESRVDVLLHNLARTGRANYAVCHFDPDPLALRCNYLFNKVLVDAPCSGQSLVGPGKHDDSAFRPQHIEHCAMRARRILRAAAHMLAPGGVLVLSTCTFSTEENEAQIEWLSREFPDTWQLIEMPELRPWQSPLMERTYRLWPHRDRCRGGFAAAVRKIADTPPLSHDTRLPTRGKRPSPKRSDSKKEKHPSYGLETLIDQIGTWPLGIRLESDYASVAEPGVDRFLFEIEDRNLYRSVRAAFLSGRHAEPSHALALASTDWFMPHCQRDLNDSQAIQFMSGQALSNERQETSCMPWVRAMWNSKPIGWLKQAGKRWNNHLPAWARTTINDSPIDLPNDPSSA